ncbi:lipoprotein [Moraxella catarrhalis]
MKKFMIAAVSAIALAGCATTANITPQYVNPNIYHSYDYT